MKHRILVVEDNALNLELLCTWLGTEGYEVLTATDLKTAFSLVESNPPHAVLLDVQLGADDGLALADWIRRQPALRHIPLIAVTAHALLSERDHILNSGCNACISKPVDFNLLRKSLDRWLPRQAN
ncbi:MAG TPA: response regulator [Candidatus Acidoferrales bacterium]|jgi:CheY-like chemotaxis protein|nr:response regulator [Candidatus Acidoferrales bacterium]